MKKFTIPDKIEPEAKAYIKDVLQMLKENKIIEDVDDAAIKMLAYNYSTFIKASKIVEKEGLTIISDRGNIAEHPAVKIGRDAQISALKVMAEFGLTARARTKLKIDKGDDDESPFEAFIKSSKEER